MLGGSWIKCPQKDVISWTWVIHWYVRNGEFNEGLKLFRVMMNSQGVKPDKVLCESILRESRGKEIHAHSIRTNVDSYQAVQNAIMDILLGHAGRFDDAKAFILEHHLEHNVRAQRAMLDGCRTHQNRKLGKQIAEALTELQPSNANSGQLYSTLKPVCLVREIEIRNKVHVFGVHTQDQ
ncbi:hypothetical protein Sjap_023159 [Stephania japonica]|uniref:Pentatricopeptide repeat-containing protein n=1 Tax=Stephania japonica TaxID=461633 RepID=A0AAP0HME5_9MAGN